ncbi:MAG: TonB-dependent receptor, partial [Bacteroidetes bacterium]|nr:TonB-dependent receptor [Bacteroidota bacterium]
IDPETGEVVSRTGPGDRKIIGNTTRKYQFGINTFASYKKFDFSFLLNGVGKRDLDLGSPLMWPYPGQFDDLYKHQLDYWTPDNQDAFYPRVHGNPTDNSGSNYGRSRRTQTKYLSNGAYLRIQNITLGYSLPQ